MGLDKVSVLEDALNSFNLDRRLEALRELKAMTDAGMIAIEGAQQVVNLHAHTFFSFNAMGYSPARFVWEAYKKGLEIAGTVDFDVIDAVEETLQAGDILGIKTTSGVESRVFIKEYSDYELNSPREPGVYYLVGHGFVARPEAGTKEAAVLGDMKKRAQDRNRYMLDKINSYLGMVEIDFEKDILPLSPGGNPTERHLLHAIDKAVRNKFCNDKRGLIHFWAEKLLPDKSIKHACEEIAGKIDDTATFVELIRAKLMKFGGVGYRQPDSRTFPALDEVVGMIRGCGALPSAAWLNGKSNGEADVRGHIEFLVSRGIEMVNIIPDRNWNVTKDKDYIVSKLGECVAVANELNLPIVVGTEMNKHGQKFADDFKRPELAPCVGDFLRGARILYGHTLLSRSLGFGYISERASALFGDDRANKNRFFEEVGKAPLSPAEALARVSQSEPQPENIKKALGL